MVKRVLFQKTRLALFSLKYSWKEGLARDPEIKQSYYDLSALAQEGFLAAQNGKLDEFIQKLDIIQAKTTGDVVKTMLDSMMDGTHDSVPPWLRK